MEANTLQRRKNAEEKESELEQTLQVVGLLQGNQVGATLRLRTHLRLSEVCRNRSVPCQPLSSSPKRCTLMLKYARSMKFTYG